MGKRILPVDDDQGARKSIKLLLTIDRHNFVEASGGAEAIKLLKSRTFDLAILDYFLPELQESQVASRISDIPPSFTILMITVYLEKLGDTDKPVEAIIAKPFSIKKLRQAVAKLLS